MKKEKCPHCGGESFKDSFLCTDKGIIYCVHGKPNMKNQLLGKRKELKVRMCESCGYCGIFGK